MMRCVWAMTAVAIVAGCQSKPIAPAGTRPAANKQAVVDGVVGMSPQDLRDVLTDLAKAHEDKIRLSTWAGTIVLPVQPAFKPYFAEMHKGNKELLAALKDWAKSHHIDLTFHYTDDVDGRALKMMEDRQEKMIRGDDQANFERDILMEMADDYGWRLAQAKALLPHVQDTKLKDYLDKNIAMIAGQVDQTRALLKRYKFQ